MADNSSRTEATMAAMDPACSSIQRMPRSGPGRSLHLVVAHAALCTDGRVYQSDASSAYLPPGVQPI